MQCSYKSRKKHVEGKVWCKIRKKKCEPGFTRVWVQGPRYLLQDDAQAKVVNITMVALRRQDSGRYWCMRNSSGTLYPLMGFQLEVSPGKQACWGTGMVGGVLPALHSTNITYTENNNPSVGMLNSGAFTGCFMNIIVTTLKKIQSKTTYVPLTLS